MEKTIKCYTSEDTFVSLTFSSVLNITPKFIITSSDKINKYFEETPEIKSSIIHNFKNTEPIILLYETSNKYNIKSAMICLIYNDLSIIHFYYDSSSAMDLMRFCIQKSYDKADLMLTKYPLITNKLKYENLYKLLLFTKSYIYWLPQELCLHIAFLIRCLMVQEYFVY